MGQAKIVGSTLRGHGNNLGQDVTNFHLDYQTGF